MDAVKINIPPHSPVFTAYVGIQRAKHGRLSSGTPANEYLIDSKTRDQLMAIAK